MKHTDENTADEYRRSKGLASIAEIREMTARVEDPAHWSAINRIERYYYHAFKRRFGREPATEAAFTAAFTVVAVADELNTFGALDKLQQGLQAFVDENFSEPNDPLAAL